MHTLARVILAVVTVFVIVVTATLVFKTRSATVEPLAGPPPSSADLQIQQGDLEEEAQGGARRAEGGGRPHGAGPGGRDVGRGKAAGRVPALARVSLRGLRAGATAGGRPRSRGAPPPASAPAASPAPSTTGGKARNSQPVTVDAEKMERFGKESLTIFTGNVIARQSNNVQYADRMEVYFDE